MDEQISIDNDEQIYFKLKQIFENSNTNLENFIFRICDNISSSTIKNVLLKLLSHIQHENISKDDIIKYLNENIPLYEDNIDYKFIEDNLSLINNKEVISSQIKEIILNDFSDELNNIKSELNERISEIKNKDELIREFINKEKNYEDAQNRINILVSLNNELRLKNDFYVKIIENNSHLSNDKSPASQTSQISNSSGISNSSKNIKVSNTLLNINNILDKLV